MRTSSPLIIDVQKVLESPGSRKPLALSAAVPGLEIGDAGVRGELRFDLVLEAMDGGVLVQGSVAGAYRSSCRRCLTELTQPFDIHVAEVYRPAGGVWEEGYVITDGTIDLDRMARDAVGLDIPLTALCRPDCAGICARCGADLNDGPCGCPPDIDPRWSAVQSQLRGLEQAAGGEEPVS